MAEKTNRAPNYHNRTIFGFLFGGYDTFSKTFTWGVKFLGDHPEVQNKLRKTLHAAFPDA
jgi:cytochrome P450